MQSIDEINWTYTNYDRSVKAFANQDVDCIAGWDGCPLFLDVPCEHDEQFRGDLLIGLSRATREPGQQKRCGSRTFLQFHKESGDLIDGCFVLRNRSASGQTGSHLEDEL